jgi:hypothetical protein
MPICFSPLVAVFALIVAVTGCQTADLTLPADGLPHRLDAVDGNGQRGTIGADLPNPLIVQLFDAAGRPVINGSIAFHSSVPDAQVDPSVVPTDDSGYASVHVRLGSLEGRQTVEAVAAENVSTSFALTATVPEQPNTGGGGSGNGSGRGDDGADDGGHDHDGHDGHEHDGHDHGHEHGHGHDEGHDHDD